MEQNIGKTLIGGALSIALGAAALRVVRCTAAR